MQEPRTTRRAWTSRVIGLRRIGPLEPGDELREEAALADPRLTLDEDDATLGIIALDGLHEVGQLAIASDQTGTRGAAGHRRHATTRRARFRCLSEDGVAPAGVDEALHERSARR